MSNAITSSSYKPLRAVLVAELCSIVERCADQGVGGVVRLHGEAGIGKTTLAETMLAVADRCGMPTWRSSASSISQALPFAVVDRLSSPTGERMLADLGLHDGAIPDAVGAAGAIATSQVSRFARREAATVLFESRCQVPSLVFVDDLQWVDMASAEVIGDLARTAVTHPVLLIVTHRSIVGNGIGELIDSLGALGSHSIAVPALGAADTHALVAALCGGQPSEALLDRANGASGNPFLLCEYVNGLLAEGQLIIGDDEVGVESGEVPESLRLAVARELQRLGEEVTMVVRACSVQGIDIDVGALAATLDQNAIALAAPLDVAVAAGLLEDRAGCLMFRHELLRAAVYLQMPVGVRKVAHQQLATALADQGANAALVGLHVVLGERTDDPAAIERLQLAAKATATSAPEDALTFLDSARSMAGVDLDLQRIIELARLVAFTALGRMEEAEAAANWLLEVVEEADRSMVLARLGGIATIMGDSARGLELLDQASECASGDLERSPILAMASLTCATTGDYERSRDLATQALEVGNRANEPVGQSVGMALLARMSTFGNDISEGLRLGTRVVAIADADLTGTAHAYIPVLHLGLTAFDADQLDLATAMVAKGNELADRYNMAWSLPLFGSLAAGIQYRLGRLDEAQAEAEVAIDLSERTVSRQATTWAHAVQALVAIDIGDCEAAERCVEAAE
ncbi:MAG: AAA family ATPase, partial [Acidimicrobiales bacterium]